MKNKLFAAAFGSFLLLAATSPAPAQKDTFIETMKFCNAAMKVYRSGPSGEQRVAEAMAAFPDQSRTAVAVVCRAYTIGYDQGQRDFIQNMT